MKIKLLFFLVLCSITQVTRPAFKFMSKEDAILRIVLSYAAAWGICIVLDEGLDKLQKCCETNTEDDTFPLSHNKALTLLQKTLYLPRVVTFGGKVSLPLMALASIWVIPSGGIIRTDKPVWVFDDSRLRGSKIF